MSTIISNKMKKNRKKLDKNNTRLIDLILERLGINQSQLAELLDLERTSVSRFKRLLDIKKHNLSALYRVCSDKVTADEFLTAYLDE